MQAEGALARDKANLANAKTPFAIASAVVKTVTGTMADKKHDAGPEALAALAFADMAD